MEESWYLIANVAAFDTPFIAVYPERVRENIDLALKLVGNDLSRFRPHIKTHKMVEVLRLFIDRGITRIKCATIAEAELAAAAGIGDVLLAYQPVGAKVDRFVRLMKRFPGTQFSCLTDNLGSAAYLSAGAQELGLVFRIYLDLNTGMNRTGYPFRENLPAFYRQVAAMEGLSLLGLHIYDGHLQDHDEHKRAGAANKVLKLILKDVLSIQEMGFPVPRIIAGGSNTFSFYAGQENIECSPGTFVFWDVNYLKALPELPFRPAAVLVATVISTPSPDTVCLDVGYKSVSSEQTLEKRMICYWNTDLLPAGHSEEHFVFRNTGSVRYEVGDVIYGIPFHICPTVALYDQVYTVTDHYITGSWEVGARGKKISI